MELDAVRARPLNDPCGVDEFLNEPLAFRRCQLAGHCAAQRVGYGGRGDRLFPDDERRGFASRVLELDKDLRIVFVNRVDQPLKLQNVGRLSRRELARFAAGRAVGDSGDLGGDEPDAPLRPGLVISDDVVIDAAAGGRNEYAHRGHDHPVRNGQRSNVHRAAKLLVHDVPAFLRPHYGFLKRWIRRQPPFGVATSPGPSECEANTAERPRWRPGSHRWPVRESGGHKAWMCRT